MQAVLREASRASARAAAVWAARVQRVHEVGKEAIRAASTYIDGAVKRQVVEWQSRSWGDRWAEEWEASRILREWGLGEEVACAECSSSVPAEYSSVDRPASAAASTLLARGGKRPRA